MIQLEKSADKYLLRDDAMEFSFRFVDDRWQNSVALRHENRWHVVLISAEGRPADAVLPSPAFQELRFEQPAEGVFEFQLMGQSGKGIYSAAVQFAAAERMLDFDLCARGPTANSSLCTLSTYRLAGPEQLPAVRNEPGSAILIPAGWGSIRIAPVPIVGNPASECRLNCEAGERELAVGCFDSAAPNTAGKFVSTRWRYRLTFSGHP